MPSESKSTKNSTQFIKIIRIYLAKDQPENLKLSEKIILLHLSWEDVQRLSERVADNIKASGFKPDLIVAVSRGGFDPARILCDQLSIKMLASLQIDYYETVGSRRENPQIVLPLNADVSGKVTLIVDDVSDSGASLNVARDHVVEHGASEVRVATLHIKPWSDFVPDYYAEEVDAWIVYPWEPRETLISMAEKLRGNGLEESELKRRLMELGFKPELIDMVL